MSSYKPKFRLMTVPHANGQDQIKVRPFSDDGLYCSARNVFETWEQDGVLYGRPLRSLTKEERPYQRKNKNENQGGKRREGRTQTPKAYRIDNDLLERLKSLENINAFVNEAIREKLDREGK